MPILKKLPGRFKNNLGNGDLVRKSNHANGELILKSNHSNRELILPPSDLNPFEGAWAGIGWNKEDGGVWENGQDYQSQVSEVLENEANAEQRGVSKVIEGSKEKRGTLERICGSSPLKTLGKLGKGLRITGRNVWGGAPSLRSATLPATPSSDKKKKRNYRRASEEIMTLLR